MKKLMKKSSIIVLLIVAFSFLGCEKDLYEDQLAKQPNYKINFKSFNELNSEIDFSTAFKTVENRMKYKSTGKSEIEELYNFKIDSSLIYEVVSEKYKTYSIKINRDYPTGSYVENLFIEIDSTNRKQISLLKYNLIPNTKQVESVENALLYTNKITYENNCLTITNVFVRTCECHGHHQPNDPACTCETPGSTTTITHTYCHTDPDTTPGGSGPAIWISNPQYSAGNLTDPSDPSVHGNTYIPIVVANILTIQEQRVKNFEMQLSNQILPPATLSQLQWWNNQPTIVKQNIISYLESGMTNELGLSNLNNTYYAQSNIDFVNQFINQSIQNPNLNFDFNASYKSPYFVDLSSINGNSPEEQNLRDVYDSLLESSGFRNLFINLFGPSPHINAKLIIQDIPQPNPNSYIDGNCTLFDPPPYVLIKFDKNFLLNRSKLDIAVVIIHECIHAYLDIIFRYPTTPSNALIVNQINNMDFQECINLNYNGFSGNQDQHSFFVDFMIPTMVSILNEIKDNIITLEQADALENPTNGGAILYQPLTSPPQLNQISDIQVNWNWTTFFYYLSHNGLQNCNSYPFSTPQNANHTFNDENDYFHFYYISAFNTIFNP